MAKSLEFLDLDFYDPQDAIIALTFSSADFRELGSNKGVYSKTLKMPATKVNDTFFGMSFEATSEGLFDPKIKVPIQISDIEFYGTLQLKSVEVLNNQPRNYVVTIFGDLADWVSLIGEKSVRDLRVWEGVTTPQSHFLNEETISASWDKNGLTGSYVYPLISYGNFLQDRDPLENIDVAFWRPAFFVLPIIKNIFKDIGYTFIDSGIAQTPLRDAILPFTSKEVDVPELEVEAEFLFSDSTPDYPLASHVYSTPSGSIPDKALTIHYDNRASSGKAFVQNALNFTTEVKDDKNLFNHEAGVYIAPSSDIYDITINISKLNANIQGLGGSVWGVLNINSQKDEVITNKVLYTATSGTTLTLFGSGELRLEQGDICTFTLYTSILRNTSVNLAVVTSNLSIKPRSTTVKGGDLLTHSKVVQNVKQIDLLKDIIRAGNFRIITDNQRKTVEFMQEGDFLTTSPEEWGDKVDESKPSSISFIQNQGAKELEWGYNNDSSDGFVVDREKRKDKEFAQQRISLDSEHRRGNQQVHKSIFSSTIDGRGAGLIVPVMSTQELKQSEPVEAGLFETGFENRILIYEGLQTGNFIIDNVAKNEYPYSYFVGTNFSLRWDSNADLSEIIGSSGAGISLGSGLVDRYYVAAINRLNNSKLYTGWFFLSNVDIENLDFRRPKIINGIHYYLNKVIDYKLNTNETTKVELISR